MDRDVAKYSFAQVMSIFVRNLNVGILFSTCRVFLAQER